MLTTRFSLAALFAATPLAAMLVVSTSACILEDDFLKQPGQFACTVDSDCSELGFVCEGGFCNPPGIGTLCIDLDGDGYGSNEDDRSKCMFSQLDKDDECAVCTPVAKETCDGFDNDTDGEIDEPVSCDGGTTACPGLDNAPAGAFWACQNSQCVLIPPLREPGSACESLTIPCVAGAFDDTQALANGCFPQ